MIRRWSYDIKFSYRYEENEFDESIFTALSVIIEYIKKGILQLTSMAL